MIGTIYSLPEMKIGVLRWTRQSRCDDNSYQGVLRTRSMPLKREEMKSMFLKAILEGDQVMMGEWQSLLKFTVVKTLINKN